MTETYRVRSAQFTLVVEEFGKGPVVIYAHGLGSNRHDTRLQWESVSGCFRVIVFDQRGHGDLSPVTNPADYNPRSMGEDIGAVMDALNLSKATVGGVSMGACTSLCFALSHPDRVEALLQTAPAIGEQPSTGMRSLLATGDLLEQKGIEGAIQETAQQWKEMGMPPEAIIEMEKLYHGFHCDSMMVAYHKVPQWALPFPQLQDLKMPVYILAWENDPVHDIAIARRMMQFLPDARLRIIPGVFTPDIGEIYKNELLGL